MASLRSENEVAGMSRRTPMLSAEGMTALHSVLSTGFADRDPDSSPGLSDALRYICGEAKLRKWPPELLLVAFKTALETAPAVQSRTRGPDRDELVARLVSLCITAYYDVSRG